MKIQAIFKNTKLGGTLLVSFLLNYALLAEGFLAGTPVKTPNGYVSIERLGPGDQIYSSSFDGYYQKTAVLQVLAKHTDILIKITIYQEILFTTPDQLFIKTTSPLEWVAATDLKVGDQLSYIGQPSEISNIEIIQTSATVYTVTASDYGNFCVSMHNLFARDFMPCVKLPPVPWYAKTIDINPITNPITAALFWSLLRI